MCSSHLHLKKWCNSTAIVMKNLQSKISRFFKRKKMEKLDNNLALDNAFEEIRNNSHKLIESTQTMIKLENEDSEMREFICENLSVLEKNIHFLKIIGKRIQELLPNTSRKETNKKIENLENKVKMLKEQK